jgi:hypothetical protein
VVDGFRDLADVPALAALAGAVPQIAASRYAAGLHPVKSMHTLLLYQHDRAGPEDERLVLECQGGELVLRHEPGRLPDRTAALRVPPTPWTKRGPDALALLERAFHHLRWFVEYREPAV